MSLFERFFGKDEPEPTGDQGLSISAASSRELATINDESERSVVIAAGERAATFSDALIPVVANATQTAQSYNMAIVKFPEGVGWADLCVRRRDGWNLLSNIKDGKFNEMAAIKQAGLQPAAVANLALQGAAVVVGQVYMTQINDKLQGITEGIEAIQRSMERDRQTKLKSHYEALDRVILMFDENGSDQSKRTVALQVVEDATREAQAACHYEADVLREIAQSIAQMRKMKRADIEDKIRHLKKAENHAAIAFQLLLAARQTGMRLECDYGPGRIEKELSIMKRVSDELNGARGSARELLGKMISKLHGKPFELADPIETEDAEGIASALEAVKRQVSRVYPLRARNAAKEHLTAEKADLRDSMGSDNAVKHLAEKNEQELNLLRFAFNEADTIVVERETIRAIKSKWPAGEEF